jgi:5-methylcytosine-specific restriction protein A
MRLSDFWIPKRSVHFFPDELQDEGTITEGAKHQVTVNAYERDSIARQKCIDHYGTKCFVCGFLFESVYGEVAKDFVHVHHLRPLSEIGSEYAVNPVEDLRPVCPNCHAVLHLGKPVFSIEEVIAFVRKRRD